MLTHAINKGGPTYPRPSLYPCQEPTGEFSVTVQPGSVRVENKFAPVEPEPGPPWLCCPRSNCNHKTRDDALACPHYQGGK